MEKLYQQLQGLRYQSKGGVEIEDIEAFQAQKEAAKQGKMSPEEEEKKVEELMKRKKKVKEVIASTIMSISRIASQLKEDNKIEPEKCDEKLSICGLRLEHMVATLYKKKPTFNIESVNTDYSSDLPPFFLGIKNTAYVSPQNNEHDLQSEIERLY